ncbi:MAG: putative beta-lysine N-acetyltransferase [Geobacteraceae bacterium]|nr:putative beta-lysine N-acetyltransferase [Geobacteraceae bacterium]NTW79123.1 putative beta-lysine N-acetyltransferase [Geobacteraceae bacterium]
MSDIIETIGSSIIQHGPTNDRLYLVKLHPDDSSQIIGQLDQLANACGYSKIFAKVSRWSIGRFVAAGYETEASIPAFFPDGAAVCFMGKYLTSARRTEFSPHIVQEVLAVSKVQGTIRPLVPLPSGCTARVAQEVDAAEMAAVYREVFATYPFPTHDPDFLQGAMRNGTIYFGVWKENKIIALSSAEIDISSRSVEMTSFATLPEYRGQGLALNLLQQMEEAVYSLGIRSLFTIARACSFGINITFARDGYRFGGTLINNTNFSGSLESMNVWHKILT